jgi:hypothetical protein
MKKSLTVLLVSAAVIIGWWQSSTLSTLRERHDRLTADIAGMQRLSDFRSHSAVKTGPSSPASLSSNDAAKPLEPSEFLEHATAIGQMEQTLAPGADRQQLRDKIAGLFQRLAITPPDRLKTIMDALPGSGISPDGKNQITGAIISVLVKSDPAAAADYALRSGNQPEAIVMAIRGWAKQDPAATAAWLEKMQAAGTLPAGPQRDELRRLVLPGLIAANPDEATLSELARMSPAHAVELLAEATGLLRDQDQRRTLWHRLAGHSGIPEEAVRRFFSETSRAASASEAFSLLDEGGASLPAGQHDAMATAIVTARIDSTTPENANRLLKELKAPDRENAIQALMKEWTHADYNGAAGWLRALPASTDRDLGVSAFASLVAGKEPPSAVDWANTIEDPELRAGTLTSLYKEWSATAPQDATAYFEKLGIATDRAP